MSQYHITKILNNNVIICTIDRQEVILLGKGIGFNKKPGMKVQRGDSIEKVYKLDQQHQLDHYKLLVAQTDESIIHAIIEAVDLITSEETVIDDKKLVISLTDHIIFAYKRLQQQQKITNPFIAETQQLYSESYDLAQRVIVQLNAKLDVDFPEDEIGFIALHIASNTNAISIHEVNAMYNMVSKATKIIEHDLQQTIDKHSIKYQRFIRHVQFLIRRIQQDEHAAASQVFEDMVKAHYALCYNVALKIMRLIQRELNVTIHESEIVYLAIHIHHFTISDQP
ncbi:glucose PTS transporter transcription antiterminator GlcT [Staphylococcus arlettae]|uniref:glucose PTS transporter transcription antiterminator GlcT n=1 Tax=Staphylococcus arlettae TaxID=29378 RepID=UPI0011A00BA7|nr:PRD domain-containing protein [Staphylococcus arlettae]